MSKFSSYQQVQIGEKNNREIFVFDVYGAPSVTLHHILLQLNCRLSKCNPSTALKKCLTFEPRYVVSKKVVFGQV